jgi:hypothetical protein
MTSPSRLMKRAHKRVMQYASPEEQISLRTYARSMARLKGSPMREQALQWLNHKRASLNPPF